MRENNQREPVLGNWSATATLGKVSAIELLADGVGYRTPAIGLALATLNTQRLLHCFESLPPSRQLDLIGIVQALAAPGEVQYAR